MKQVVILTSLFLLIQFSAHAQKVTEITVQLVGLNSDEGQLMVGLYSAAASWLQDSIKGEITQIVDGKATVVFSGLSEGTYAISAFHDENSNGKLDTGWFGIPTEPYACSRGAKGKFGPPKWADAVLELNQETMTTIIHF